MGDKEQEEIINELRKKVVNVEDKKPETEKKLEEEDILKKAQEAAEVTADDDSLPS